MKLIVNIVLCIWLAAAAFADDTIRIQAGAEFGFISIMKHEIQSGSSSDKGDVFDYRTQGNQDVLFPFYRYKAEVSLPQKHHVVFLYQPLTVVTQAEITESFRYNEVDYSEEDGFLNLTYAFDFWRFSYLYDLYDTGYFFFSPGLSLQIRNASIVFRAEESSKGSISDGIGPVPIIKMRTGYKWDNGVYIMFEGDGFYASNKFINGAEYPFTGYIYDLSGRTGYRINTHSSAYLNLRFLGGGAEGTNDEDEYTYNDLHTIGLTLGYQYEF